MKPITITNGIFISGVTLKKKFEFMVDVYSFGNYVGCLYTKEYKLKYSDTVFETKYYTVERR